MVDLHAVTIPYEPAEMPGKVMDLATTLYACGIDMEKTTLFVQSEVPGHADLTWLFNTITPLGELERMTQFKDKRDQFRATVNVGPAGLPRAPGRGHPHLQGRGRARRGGPGPARGVHPRGGAALQLPLRRHLPRVPGAPHRHAPRVLGLDGDAKMSKSKGNTIGVLETPEQIWAKLAPAKTDPARVRRTDPGTPEKCTIWSYHLLVTQEPELQGDPRRVHHGGHRLHRLQEASSTPT